MDLIEEFNTAAAPKPVCLYDRSCFIKAAFTKAAFTTWLDCAGFG